MADLVCTIIAVGGRRDILACELMTNESEKTCGGLFESLKKRGLKGCARIRR